MPFFSLREIYRSCYRIVIATYACFVLIAFDDQNMADQRLKEVYSAPVGSDGTWIT